MGLTTVFALLLGTAISLTSSAFYYSGYVNSFLGIKGETIPVGEGSNYYPSAYGELSAENSEKLIAAEMEHNLQAMYEGAVLLRNESKALPLSENERSITFFGNSVKDPIYRTNAGQASFNADRGGDLYTAFTAAGFKINQTMYDAYMNSEVVRVSSSTPGTSSIGEVDSSFYTDGLKNSFANDYNDVAIVLFTRYGGEGVDLDPRGDADGLPLLALHPQEEDLLKMIHESGKFAKTVVLINSPFAMDVEWIEDEQYGVDACIAFGAAGDVGFVAIADILTGKSDISGHLADTWATSSLSSAAMQNFGDFTFANHDTKYERNYVVYAENVYVGYKYYETRYQDCVLGVNNADSEAGTFASSAGWNYAEEMAYPFGYGLSYAQFSQEMKSLTWDRDAHKVTAVVNVTNLGTSDGSVYTGSSKALVQLYAQLPYESGQAQKSAIQMIGFAKTDLLAAGESQEVTIEVDDYAFAAYDMNAVNGADSTKTGCYVFDAGDYYFAIGDSAHDALNNVMAAKGITGMYDQAGNPVEGDTEKAVLVTLDSLDNVTYAKSTFTDEVVSNHLAEADLNFYKEGEVEYLTRDDWNTFPKTYTDISVTDEMKVLLKGATYEKPSDAPTVDSITVGADNGLTLLSMQSEPFDSETWSSFMDQLTVDQLATICGDNRGNVAITSVGKPANASTNGPNGIQGSYVSGNGKGCTLFVDEVVQASTWNLDLARERGEFFAEDAMYTGVTMVFGPGANIHRTAYLGRNSEYFSEDGWMSYLMSRTQATAMTEKGVITGFKHFALNDQETNRHGVATFATEQACREIYFKAFEGALADGAGLGVMTSYNRIGLVASPACSAAQVQILRNEWGFKGINITDSSKDASDYVLTSECITSGTDLFLSDTGRTNELVKLAKLEKDGNILNWMKTANQHFYYAHSKSILTNGLTETTEIHETVYWWQPALIGICVGFGVLSAASLLMFVKNAYFKKRRA